MTTILDSYGLENTLEDIRTTLDEAAHTNNPFKKNELIQRALGLLDGVDHLVCFEVNV